MASNAVDGDLSTISIATTTTRFGGSFTVGDHWWKVDIEQKIIFTNATIYVRDGICRPPGAAPLDCCKYS